MSQPSDASPSALRAAAICFVAAFAVGIYANVASWFERFAFDLVGGGLVGDLASGVLNAPIAAAIPLAVVRSPLRRSMPWLAGNGQYVAAGILFVLGLLGPIGLLTVLGGTGIVAGFAWATQLPFHAEMSHRAAVAVAGLVAFGVALVALLIVGLAPISAIIIFPMHLGLWLGLRRERALAMEQRAG